MGNMIPEIEAREILENYDGSNNQILEWKSKLNAKTFKITRTQAEYIIKFSSVTPKIARKYLGIAITFAEKLSQDRGMSETPYRIWAEKLLCETDKAFHIWGKVIESDKLQAMWVPKAAVIVEEKKLNREID